MATLEGLRTRFQESLASRRENARLLLAQMLFEPKAARLNQFGIGMPDEDDALSLQRELSPGQVIIILEVTEDEAKEHSTASLNRLSLNPKNSRVPRLVIGTTKIERTPTSAVHRYIL